MRDAIIKASLELGSELGEEGLTMRGIAARLGVSATALYQHFESKASILREIRFHGLQVLLEALAPSATISDPVERMSDMALRYIQFARENRWLYSVLMEQDPTAWSELASEEAGQLLAPLQAVREGLRDGVKSGRFRADLDVDMASFQLWAAIHGLASLILGGRISEEHPAFPIDSKEKFVRSFVGGMLDGFTG